MSASVATAGTVRRLPSASAMPTKGGVSVPLATIEAVGRLLDAPGRISRARRCSMQSASIEKPAGVSTRQWAASILGEERCELDFKTLKRRPFMGIAPHIRTSRFGKGGVIQNGPRMIVQWPTHETFWRATIQQLNLFCDCSGMEWHPMCRHGATSCCRLFRWAENRAIISDD